MKRYAKKYQYRKYKEVYKADINLLKEIINDCSEFKVKVNLKMKYKTIIMNGGRHYIAIYFCLYHMI